MRRSLQPLLLLAISGLAAGAACSGSSGLLRQDAGPSPDAAPRDAEAGGSDAGVSTADRSAIDPPMDGSSVEALAGPEVGNMMCDPVAQNCAAGSKCELSCVPVTGLRCAPDPMTGGAHGDACGQSIGDCQKGAVCILNMPAGTGARCRKYCTSSATCPGGGTCQAVNLACNDMDPAVMLGLCSFPPSPPDAGGTPDS